VISHRTAAFSLALLAALPAHAAAPVTGRAQELRYSPQELIAATSRDVRRYLARLERDRLIDRHSPTARRIRRIFDLLLPQAKRLHPDAAAWNWQLIVTREAGAGSHALPDGKILIAAHWVTRHALSDPELALLVAHEMAHVVASHMLERVSSFAARSARRPKVAALLRQLNEHWYLARDIAPLMRVQELEADRIGAAIIGASGLPLAAAVTLFDRMARGEGDSGQALVESHLGAGRRKADLLAWERTMDLPSAGAS
jgi:Zn-dependent protease with chaperone function